MIMTYCCIFFLAYFCLLWIFFFFFFFFSSRRRHTRSYGDWSSDVCSSDLERPVRLDSRVVPALLFLEVHHEHVVGEDIPERQLAVLRLLLLRRRACDPDRLSHVISLPYAA